MAASTTNLEDLAFQRGYTTLLKICHGIDVISDKTFAENLISESLRKRCQNKDIAEEERTRLLLNALQDRVKVRPEALTHFARILKETSGLDYIGEELLKKLREVSDEQVVPTAETRDAGTCESFLTLSSSCFSGRAENGGIPISSFAQFSTSGSISSFSEQADRKISTGLTAEQGHLTGTPPPEGGYRRTSTGTPPPEGDYRRTSTGTPLPEGGYRRTSTGTPPPEGGYRTSPPPEGGYRRTSTGTPPPQRIPIIERLRGTCEAQNPSQGIQEDLAAHSNCPPSPFLLSTPPFVPLKRFHMRAGMKQPSIETPEQTTEEGKVLAQDGYHQSFLRPKVKVSVQAASPISNMVEVPHPLTSRAASMEENVRASLEIPETIACLLMRSCSASSTESDYTTPRQSWSEVEAEAAILLDKLAERPASATKSPCSNCLKLRRSLSKSEDEIRKLLAKLNMQSKIMQAQVEQLREEVFLKDQESCALRERCADVVLYVQELEETVTQLSASVEREEIEKHKAQRHSAVLLEVLQKCSMTVQTTQCNPIYINMQEGRISQAQGAAAGGGGQLLIESGGVHRDNGRGSEFAPACQPNGGGVRRDNGRGSEFAPACRPNGGDGHHAQNGSEFAPVHQPNGGDVHHAQNGSEFAPVHQPNGGSMHARSESHTIGHTASPVRYRRRPTNITSRGDSIIEKLVELLNPSDGSPPPRGSHASHSSRVYNVRSPLRAATAATPPATPPPNLCHSVSSRNSTHIHSPSDAVPYRHASHHHSNTFAPLDGHTPHHSTPTPSTHHQNPTPPQSSPEHLPQTETGYWEAERDFVNPGGNFLPL